MRRIKKQLQKYLLYLAYFDLFTNGTFNEKADGNVLLPCGLQIKYGYFFYDDTSNRSSISIQLLFDNKYPVLLVHSIINEGKHSSYYNKGIWNFQSPTERLSMMLLFFKTIKVEKSVYYRTSYQPASWMVSALKGAFEDKINAFDNESYQKVKDVQAKINCPINQASNLDKEELLKELKALLDAFAFKLTEETIGDDRENAIREIKEEYLKKLEQVLRTTKIKEKEKKLK